MQVIRGRPRQARLLGRWMDMMQCWWLLGNLFRGLSWTCCGHSWRSVIYILISSSSNFFIPMSFAANPTANWNACHTPRNLPAMTPSSIGYAKSMPRRGMRRWWRWNLEWIWRNCRHFPASCKYWVHAFPYAKMDSFLRTGSLNRDVRWFRSDCIEIGMKRSHPSPDQCPMTGRPWHRWLKKQQRAAKMRQTWCRYCAMCPWIRVWIP